jgi:hypothetical protein
MGLNLKLEVEICKIVRRYLTEEQIEENFQKSFKEYYSSNNYSSYLEDLSKKKCREMVLSQIPKTEFTALQLVYIRQEWGIDI